MKQTNSDYFNLRKTDPIKKDDFEKLMVEISRHDYGSPVKEYPRFVAMKGIDDKLPPDSAINNGSLGIRKYWNSKNLRKRSKEFVLAETETVQLTIQGERND